MGFTVFHRKVALPAARISSALEAPAVAVCYSAGGLHQVDALVLNAAAVALLDALDFTGGRVDECELLYDPATELVGIRPWHVGRPMNTLHPVVDTRWRTHDGPGGEDGEINAARRRNWPRKIEAPQFMGCWALPDVPPSRPAAARATVDMVVFNPREVVNA